MGIESEVFESFLGRIRAEPNVPSSIPDQLEALLSRETLPKPEELATLYAEGSGEPEA